MEGWQKEVLRRHRVAILDDLYVDYVVDHLLAKEVLLPDHVEIIFKQSTRKEQSRYLLDLLPSLGPSAFHEFIASLRRPYNWLADSLSQENKNTTTTICVPVTSNNVDKQQKVRIFSEEICQLLSNLSSVASSCETDLCAIRDSLAESVQTMMVVENIPNEDFSVVRKNSMNSSHGDSLKRNVARLKGGSNLDTQDAKENERVTAEIEEVKFSPDKISITSLSGVQWKINNVEGMMSDKVVGNMDYIEQNVSIAYTNEIHKEPALSDVMSPSHEIGPPINSPDSGIISPCEMIDLDGKTESNRTIPIDALPDAGKTGESINSTSDPSAPQSEITTVLDEVERLQRSLTDIVGALASIVRHSNGTLEIANSVKVME